MLENRQGLFDIFKFISKRAEVFAGYCLHFQVLNRSVKYDVP